MLMVYTTHQNGSDYYGFTSIVHIQSYSEYAYYTRIKCDDV
jgi:hypothetical protein